MTRATNMVVKYMGRKRHDPRDSLAARQAQRLKARKKTAMVANNVGELIAILSKYPASTRCLTIDPPFDGVKVVDQENGSVLICRPRMPESKSSPVAEQVCK